MILQEMKIQEAKKGRLEHLLPRCSMQETLVKEQTAAFVFSHTCYKTLYKRMLDEKMPRVGLQPWGRQNIDIDRPA